MRIFKTDLHIHSCLSPCGDLEMSPRAIVEKSLERGLHLIALCDHNSAENVGAAMRAGSARGLPVLAGMEVNSQEEVHVLALFEDQGRAEVMQDVVYRHLEGSNRPDLFGDQVVVNENDEVEGFSDLRLIGATRLGIREIVEQIHAIGGLAISSHVDRPSFSILSQLGFVPPELDLDALEVSRQLDASRARVHMPETKGYPVVAFSDAHFLSDIGAVCTGFMLKEPSLSELRLALKEVSGRRVVYASGFAGDRGPARG